MQGSFCVKKKVAAMTGLKVRTVAEDGTLQERMEEMYSQLWPRAILEGQPAGDYDVPEWVTIYRQWPQFQFALLDAEDRLVCTGNAVELPWQGDPEALPDAGYDWAITTACKAAMRGEPATMLCALGITVAPACRGQGISRVALEVMRTLGRTTGHTHLIAPVRPTAKERYPLIPMQTYMRWCTEDGLPFDPWLRAHVRVGGQIVKSCPTSLSVQGTVAEWRKWGGLPLPGSGHYLLPGLFAPTQIDIERDHGLYIEPAVWVIHNC